MTADPVPPAAPAASGAPAPTPAPQAAPKPPATPLPAAPAASTPPATPPASQAGSYPGPPTPPPDIPGFNCKWDATANKWVATPIQAPPPTPKPKKDWLVPALKGAGVIIFILIVLHLLQKPQDSAPVTPMIAAPVTPPASPALSAEDVARIVTAAMAKERTIAPTPIPPPVDSRAEVEKIRAESQIQIERLKAETAKALAEAEKARALASKEATVVYRDREVPAAPPATTKPAEPPVIIVVPPGTNTNTNTVEVGKGCGFDCRSAPPPPVAYAPAVCEPPPVVYGGSRFIAAWNAPPTPRVVVYAGGYTPSYDYRPTHRPQHRSYRPEHRPCPPPPSRTHHDSGRGHRR